MSEEKESVVVAKREVERGWLDTIAEARPSNSVTTTSTTNAPGFRIGDWIALYPSGTTMRITRISASVVTIEPLSWWARTLGDLRGWFRSYRAQPARALAELIGYRRGLDADLWEHPLGLAPISGFEMRTRWAEVL